MHIIIKLFKDILNNINNQISFGRIMITLASRLGGSFAKNVINFVKGKYK